MIVKKITKYEGYLDGATNVPFETTYYFLGAPIFKRVVTYHDSFPLPENPRKVMCYLFGIRLFTLIVQDYGCEK